MPFSLVDYRARPSERVLKSLVHTVAIRLLNRTHRMEDTPRRHVSVCRAFRNRGPGFRTRTGKQIRRIATYRRGRANSSEVYVVTRSLSVILSWACMRLIRVEGIPRQSRVQRGSFFNVQRCRRYNLLVGHVIELIQIKFWQSQGEQGGWGLLLRTRLCRRRDDPRVGAGSGGPVSLIGDAWRCISPPATASKAVCYGPHQSRAGSTPKIRSSL